MNILIDKMIFYKIFTVDFEHEILLRQIFKKLIKKGLNKNE